MNTVPSAPKLLKMVVTGDHMSYCPHKDKGKGIECICFMHAVRKWNDNRLSRRVVHAPQTQSSQRSP